MRLATAALGVIAAGHDLPAFAMPSAYDRAFVAEFEQACVPGRLGYETSRQAASAAGWREVGQDAHPELDAMMQIAERAILEDDELDDPTFDATFYGKDIEGRSHFLVVSRSSFVIGDPDDPLNPWAYIGCYLYDFDATQPVDPAPVSDMVGKPISHSISDETITTHVWGPPCPMPRTGDTYLSYIPDGSPLVARTGFSGQVLKFETSEPDPGAPEPEPYC